MTFRTISWPGYAPVAFVRKSNTCCDGGKITWDMIARQAALISSSVGWRVAPAMNPASYSVHLVAAYSSSVDKLRARRTVAYFASLLMMLTMRLPCACKNR